MPCTFTHSCAGLAFAMTAAAIPAAGNAQSAGDTVVVTGSLTERAVADAPYAVTVLGADELRAAGPLVNLSEALVRVPGLAVNNRHNYAQDLQISARGFGARAGFGVRGLRLYSDGIPATMPDGQGQVAHFDLAGASRVEVLRGPFSVLYGNSSGGVIAVFTAPAERAEGEAALDLGSFGLRQIRAAVSAPLGHGVDLRASASALEIDGFRPHSAARRTLGNVRLGWRGEADRVVLQAGTFDQPADDPLGLTRAQFDQDPRQTTPQAETFDTRKAARQRQAGASWTHRFGESALRESTLAVYGGERTVTQWLAIAEATQATPRHGGGVIDLDRRYGGGQGRLRWAWDGLDLVAGASLEGLRDERRGFENFSGGQRGVTGRLRRDEANRAETKDVFAQAEARLSSDWTGSAGLRAGRVVLEADDDFQSNGDDSGRLRFDYRNPVLGVRWQPSRALQWHASIARGFDAPTLAELAYRADGIGGFNTGLAPQRSRQAEIGAKWRSPAWDIDAALFRVDVADEIGVATNAGGRSAFQNIGRTRRSGAEASLAWRPAPAWHGRVVLNALDARARDGFFACAGIPCTAPSVPVPAGNRVAGTQRASGWAEAAWRDAAWGEAALEMRAVGRTPVDDANSEFAPGHALVGLRWTRRVTLTAGWAAEWLLRLDNAADRRVVGSVIVNDANRRFHEPGAPRAVLLALRLQAAP